MNYCGVTGVACEHRGPRKGVGRPFLCNNPAGKCDLEDTVTVPLSKAPPIGAEPSAGSTLEPKG